MTNPSFIEDDTPFQNTYISRRKYKSCSWIAKETEARNYFSGEGQQQFNKLTNIST
jgi:hypothetical protein